MIRFAARASAGMMTHIGFAFITPMICALAAVTILPSTARAQWTHNFPLLDGYSHHLKVETEHLPIATGGFTDPRTCGREVALSHNGWIWIYDPESGSLRRLTSASGIDGSPTWSPDCTDIVFVREEDSLTKIVNVNTQSLSETILLTSDRILADPSFEDNGRYLLYSSAEAGELDVWRLDLRSQLREKLISEGSLEVRPVAHGDTLYYVSSETGLFQRNRDEVVAVDRSDGSRTVLASEYRFAFFRPVLRMDKVLTVVPSGRTRALAFLQADGPPLPIPGARGAILSADWLDDQNLIISWIRQGSTSPSLFALNARGGTPRKVEITSIEYGVEVGELHLNPLFETEEIANVPLKWSITDEQGHPFFPPGGEAHYDLQTREWYSIVRGSQTVRVPTGQYRISMWRGLEVQQADIIEVTKSGATYQPRVMLQRPFAGWYAGDHHVHMNWGGTYLFDPSDLIIHAEAEDLNIVSVLAANSYVHYFDTEFVGTASGVNPIIEVGQEIRAHHTGHMAIVNSRRMYGPGYWGPSYPAAANIDLIQADLAREARGDGALVGFVHPILIKPFFRQEGLGTFYASELVPGVVWGDVDYYELAGLWTDEFGSAELWYEILNAGFPVIAASGTDSFASNVRGMSLGSTRTMVHVDGDFSRQDYYLAFKQGRSFVTTGPDLVFEIDGQPVGSVVVPRDNSVCFRLSVSAVLPLSNVEIIHNGNVVATFSKSSSGIEEFRDCINVSSGGWLAARAFSDVPTNETSDTYYFAHTNPIWIERIGSTEHNAEALAIHRLRQVVALGQYQVDNTYPGYSVSRLSERLKATDDRLRLRLEALAN